MLPTEGPGGITLSGSGMSEKFSRRNLFRLRIRDMASAWGEASKEIGKSIAPKKRLRPPGAIPDDASFLETCTRCHACADACPFGIIHILGPLAGEGEGTPVLKLTQDPCHWCSTMDCIHACPSGALSIPEDGKTPPIGKVWLDREQCLNAEDMYCDTCVMYCPSDVRAITMGERFPELDESACVGCGLCVFHCQSDPKALHWYQPEKPSQPQAKHGV